MSAIVSSHRVFDGANHGAPAMYSGASGCSSMQMGPEGLLIKCGFGYSDVSRCIYAPGSSTPASPSGSSPRLRPHRAPVHPELTSHGVHADALCAGCSHSVHFLVGQACSRSFLWFRRRADQRVVGLAVGLCIRANPLIPRGNQPLDPRSPVPTTLHCFHHISGRLGRFIGQVDLALEQTLAQNHSGIPTIEVDIRQEVQISPALAGNSA